MYTNNAQSSLLIGKLCDLHGPNIIIESFSASCEYNFITSPEEIYVMTSEVAIFPSIN